MRTFPAWIQLVQTLRVLTEPEERIARTFCKLGRKRRRVMPVVFLPIPPDFFERPRRAIEFPTIGFFPQTAHVFNVLFLPLRSCATGKLLINLISLFAFALIRATDDDVLGLRCLRRKGHYRNSFTLGKCFFMGYTSLPF